MRASPIVSGLILTLSLYPSLSSGQEAFEDRTPIELATSPALSPNGSQIAFAWAGDIWTAKIRGGRATRLTTHPAIDQAPVFSPDGKQIAFSSLRTGSEQVFIMPANGGAARQVTFHSEGSRAVDWYPDGNSLLIRGPRDFGSRNAIRFYRINLRKREAEVLLFDAEAGEATISPDGKRLLLTREGNDLYRKGYRGTRVAQIWLAENLESPNPKFTKVIARDTGARSPMWKPDGSGFYYAGDHGDHAVFDIWDYDLKSGKEKPLTHLKEDPAILPAIARDGSVIVFRTGFEFARVHPGTEGKAARVRPIGLFAAEDSVADRVVRRTLSKATNVSFSGDALEMAFTAGGDIWVMDTLLKEPVPITQTPAEEREPVISPDGKSVYFIRDDGVKVDLWFAERSEPNRYWWQNREFKETRLTRDGALKHDLNFVPGGKEISYHVGAGDLWVSGKDGKNARRLIESWSALQYDWSPDGKWIAYARSDNDFNRDIWIAPKDGKRAPFNLSRHPDSDGNPKWSPNGKILAFTGRRFETETDIYYVYLSRSDEEEGKRDRTLKSAVEKMTKERKKPAPAPAPTPTPATPAKPKAEPAKPGKPAADPKNANAPAPSPPAPPKPEAPAGNGASEKADPPDPAKTPPPAAPKPAPPAAPKLPAVKIDFDGIYERIRRISIPDSAESNLFWAHDSKRLAFNAEVKGAKGTFLVTFPDKLTPTPVNAKQGALAKWIAKNDTILWLVDGVPASLSKGKLTAYSFKALQKFDRTDYWRTGFRQIWRTMRDVWYDESLNGNDWDAIREKYEEAAAKAADTKAFERVVAMLLGELNGSHLGFKAVSQATWRPSSGWAETTAHLGVRFDRFFPGPGLKITSVVPKGPAAKVGTRLAVGDVVLEIDGEKVDRSVDLTRILNGPLDRDVGLKVREVKLDKETKAAKKVEDEDEKEEEEGDEGKKAPAKKPAPKFRVVTIRPVSYAAVRSLLQQEVIDRNRELVERLGKGKIGYVYVPKMAWNEFIRFEEEIYARGAGKDGLIIDVRNNGGGFTADHLLTVLTPAEHAFTVPRGGGIGYPQDRRVYATWNKPVTVLCNQNSFSNAEIFSHAIHELDRGKLVGVTTAGGVISTGSKGIMDIGILRIPFRGWFRLSDGQDMELNGAVPDVEIWPLPGELPRGKDRQIEKAVTILAQDIKAFQATPKPVPVRASQR